DPALPHQAGKVGARAGVDHRRPTHGEDLAAAGLADPDPFGDLADQQLLGFLGRHLRGHELERIRTAWALEGLHADAVEADDHQVAGAHAVHGRGGDAVAVADDDGAVHLRVFHVDPVSADPDLGLEVGGRVEPFGQHTVAIGGLERGVGILHPVGAVQLQLREERGQHVLVIGLNLDTGVARVGAGTANLDVDHAVLGTGID